MRKRGMKLLGLGLAAMLMMQTTGCSVAPAVQGQVLAAKYPQSIKSEDYDARVKNQTQNQLDASFIDAYRSFSEQTKTELLNEKEKNIAYSPLSLYLALSVLANGADGQTKEEMFSLLGVSNHDVNYLREQTGKMYRLLYRDNEEGVCKIANSVWARNDFPFLKEYMDSVQKDFYADLYQVDFEKEQSRKLMNTWVSDHTGGLITPDLKPDNQIALIIMNTLYLKANFEKEFNKEATKEEEFTTADGSKVTCDFMHQTLDSHTYLDGDGYQAVNLPLSNEGQMTFILPDEGVTPAELLANPSRLRDVDDQSKYTKACVNLTVPKFDAANQIDLITMLEKLGMKSAVDPNTANFQKMTKNSVYLSEATQDVRVKLDEHGVEAAAFTMLAVKETCMEELEQLVVVDIDLDHPFIYEIKDENGLLLFTGVLNTLSK